MSSAYVPLLFAAAFAAVTAVRSYSLWWTVGVNPYVIDHGDPVHRFVLQVFAAVVVGFSGYFVLLAVAPEIEGQLGAIAAVPQLRLVSVALMAFATAWKAYAQFSMGSSWRIGIPAEAPPLRTDGPFAVSRNPIFLGMLLFVVGLALWSPSAVTIALFVATYIALEVQIRGEEVFLERMHGEPYRAYRARVRRWI
jgi:protein-S-isoprenylcysteine O-methyltransferase Ste14